MSPCRTAAFIACSLLLLSFAACDDPSGVGLDVGPRGFQGGTPVTVALEPTTFEVTSIDDVTGNSSRVLAGTVEDPTLGTVQTIGHLDVSPPSSLPEGFEDAAVDKAELVLVPAAYVYGDTLQEQQIEVFDMSSEWDASGRTADDPLSPGPHVTTSAAFTPGDTVTIDLPDDWTSPQSLNDTTDFDADFHGFQLRTTGGNAVTGYQRSDSYLRVIAGEDTASYPASKSFTAIERLDEATLDLPSDRVLIQDGMGQAISLSFTLPDSLRDAPISRAELRLPADTSLFDAETLPAHFSRSRTNDFVLEGFLDNGDRAFAVSNSLNTEGHFAFTSGEDLLAPPVSPRTISLRQIFQQVAFGERSIDRYQITLSQAANTISPFLFYTPGTGTNAPRILLTITRSSD